MLRFMLGALIGLVVIAVIGVSVSFVLFARSIEGEVDGLIAAARTSTETVTEERLAQLPEPIRRHLVQAGVVGHKIPTLVRLTQTGRIRNAEDSGWMSFEAEEIYSTNPPGFVWKAWFPNPNLPIVFGRDHYLDGDGRITMRLLGTLAVANVGGGAEMNHAGLMRYLNEMMWFPAALAGSNVSYTEIDDNSVEIAITDHGITANARLVIDDEGRLTNFIARRFNTGTNATEEWQTPMGGYATFDGVTIPARGEALWQLPEGPFTYIEAEVTSVTQE